MATHGLRWSAAAAFPRPLAAGTLVGGVLLVLLVIVVGGPVALVVWNSVNVSQTGRPPTFTLDAWRSAFESTAVFNTLVNSVLLSVTRVGIGIVIAVSFVWLIVRSNMPGRNTIEFLLWLAFFLPPLPVTLGWILLLDPRFGVVNQAFRALPFATGPLLDIFSFWGIVIVHVTLSVVPALVILVAPAFRLFDSVLEESARMSGANSFQVLQRVTLPILAPAILSAMLLSLIRVLESFEVEQLLGTPAGLYVFPTGIYNRLRFEPPDWGGASALGTMLLVLLLAVLGTGRMWLRGREYATVGGRGVSRTRVDLGPWRWIAFGFGLAFVLVGSIIPLAMLLLGTFMKLYGFFHIASPFTLNNWQRVLSDPLLVNSLKNSLILGVGSAVIGTLAMAVLAYALARRAVAGVRAIEFVVWLPWCLPGILLGLGLLWALVSNPVLRPLYGTMAGLILVMVIKEMPLALQLMKASVQQISVDLEHAAAISGATWHRTFRSITFPLIAPTAASVMLLVFMASVRDVSTVVLLATHESTTLALLVLQYSVGGSLEAAAVIGVITSALVIAVALISRKLGLRMALR